MEYNLPEFKPKIEEFNIKLTSVLSALIKKNEAIKLDILDGVKNTEENLNELLKKRTSELSLLKQQETGYEDKRAQEMLVFDEQHKKEFDALLTDGSYALEYFNWVVDDNGEPIFDKAGIRFHSAVFEKDVLAYKNADYAVKNIFSEKYTNFSDYKKYLFASSWLNFIES
jgi:hypothetical protein